MELLVAWLKAFPAWLSLLFNVLSVALFTAACLTLIVGVWLGFCITRKRMNSIVEIQFFPPSILFRDKDRDRDRDREKRD